MHHPLPEPLTVLAVSADDARHAPVRALLKAFPMPVSARRAATADEAVAALAEADVVLVDRRLDPPGTDGRSLAEELVQRAPRTPVIVLCHESDRAADQQAADAGIADFLLVPGLSADRLEHTIRFALTHQRTLRASAHLAVSAVASCATSVVSNGFFRMSRRSVEPKRWSSSSQE